MIEYPKNQAFAVGLLLNYNTAWLGAKRDFEVWTYDSDFGLLSYCYSSNDPTLLQQIITRDIIK